MASAWQNSYAHSCCGVGIRTATVSRPEEEPDWDLLLSRAFPRSRKGYVTMISLPASVEEQLRTAWQRRSGWQICGRTEERIFIILCHPQASELASIGEDPDTFKITDVHDAGRGWGDGKADNLRSMAPRLAPLGASLRNCVTLYLCGCSTSIYNRTPLIDHIEATDTFLKTWKPEESQIYHAVLAGSQEAVLKPTLEAHGWKRVVLTRNPNTNRRIAVYVPGGQLDAN